jgi:hypothetical protein
MFLQEGLGLLGPSFPKRSFLSIHNPYALKEENIHHLTNIWMMFRNNQNCAPEPISILGTVSDSLETLNKKEVTFIPLTSFYFSASRVTSNMVSDIISPAPTASKSPPEYTS